MSAVTSDKTFSPPVLTGDMPSKMPFSHSATVVLGALQQSLLDLFAAAPSEIRKAADVERVFGINHLLGWQTYRIAHAQNPMAAGMHVPAKVSMKKLLTAAARRRVPAEIITRISEAFDAFERLVELDAGSREEFEAMLNAFLPEERRKQELVSKQAAFRALSQLKGTATEVEIAAMFFHPSADGESVDRVTLACELGLRRSRPETSILLASGDSGSKELFRAPILTLDGKPSDGPLGILLPQFSTSPLPEFSRHTIGSQIHYCIAGDDVGLRSAADLVMAERREAALPRHWKPGMPRFAGPAYTVDSPVKRLTYDVYVHRDVYPGVAPQLWVYDTAARGQVVPIDDPNRQFDRQQTEDTIRPLPPGLAGAHMPHAPRYMEMLEHIFTTVGWKPAEFRAYRLDIQYPIYATEYILGFRLPDESAKTQQ